MQGTKSWENIKCVELNMSGNFGDALQRASKWRAQLGQWCACFTFLLTMEEDRVSQSSLCLGRALWLSSGQWTVGRNNVAPSRSSHEIAWVLFQWRSFSRNHVARSEGLEIAEPLDEKSWFPKLTGEIPERVYKPRTSTSEKSATEIVELVEKEAHLAWDFAF